MADKRKDNNGRNLFVGECQRKDGSYMYRYYNGTGTRKMLYAPTLNKLREKEKQIKIDLYDNIVIDNSMTVEKLLKSYLSSKKQWSTGTIYVNNILANRIKKHSINSMKVVDVKQSRVRQFYIELYNEGLKFKSIRSYKTILQPAFQQEVDDDIIRKNPFNLKIDFIPRAEQNRPYLTATEQKNFMSWVKESKFNQYYDIWNVLVNTGLRIGEFMGVRVSDIDFSKRTISIHHQLALQNRDGNLRYYYMDLKTKASKREIYLSDEAIVSLKNLVKRRKKYIEVVIDGESGFLMLGDGNGGMLPSQRIAQNLTSAVKEYNRTHIEKIPAITPHALRRTFCTRMVELGIDVKSLQYVMGHTDVEMSLNVYTRWNHENATNAMKEVLM